jgi:hypothetical protein
MSPTEVKTDIPHLGPCKDGEDIVIREGEPGVLDAGVHHHRGMRENS